VDRVMLPNGEIKAVSEVSASPEFKPVADKLQSAQQLVIATPRRATLAPGKGQTIRIRVSPPPAATGEYRTHLTVTTIPPRDVGLTAEQAANQRPGELSFRIQSVFGLSIPVIVRPGDVDVKAAIENVSMSYADISPDGVAPPKRTPVLSFDLTRAGSNSLFGNVEIHGAGGQKAPIGLARGVGVYPEIDRRSIRIPLQRAPQAGEQLSIVFTDDDAKPGSVIARSSFTAS
ncbi:MAG TPA: fimbria/pilus periplasmic chaperone, partial [Allosphingosinicella sp.]|uniref:fimbria/pilus periplasmic chaperone n=1 Tax=Allosphingosinicella sp. TaxID=2823234 RepID=UPI002ED7BD1F